MKVYFSQIYIRPGVNFPFSHHFQVHLSNVITDLVVSSPSFVEKYGDGFDLIFRISAKREIRDNELRGPTVFKKEKNIEYTVFLPFDVVHCASNANWSALCYLLDGVKSVLESLDINADMLSKNREALVERVLSDPIMLKHRSL